MLSLLLASLLAMPGASAPAASSSPPPSVKGTEPVVELRAPLFSEAFADTPVASVNGEPIRLRELTDVLAQAHDEHGMGTKKQQAGEQDIKKILDRLVTLWVVAAEARNMGMHEIPDVAKAFEQNRARVARQIVKERATADVKPDPEEVKLIVRQLTRELKIDAVFFKEPKEADALRKAVEAGGSFATLSAEAIAAGKATSGAIAEYVKPDKLLPAVAGALEGVKVGQLAKAVVVTPKGAAVVLLQDERFPENAEALAEAEETSRDLRVQAATARYYEALRKKHATVDAALLKSANFNSAKAFAARTKDKRALARIKGARPVTVAELADAMGKQFFHGVERRADNKELTPLKQNFFEVLLFDRLLDREAELQGVSKSTEYVDRVGGFERAQLFGKFVDRVLVPDVDVKENEAKERYEAKKASYTTPPMLSLEALAFEDAKHAKAALDKAQKGAEFRWLAEHADGRIAPDKQTLRLGGRPVTLKGLSEGLARSLRGAQPDDYRVHVEGDQHYVIHVVGQVPESVRPYPEVRQEIVNALFTEKLEAAMHAYVEKLRDVHEVKVFATRIGT